MLSLQRNQYVDVGPKDDKTHEIPNGRHNLAVAKVDYAIFGISFFVRRCRTIAVDTMERGGTGRGLNLIWRLDRRLCG